MNIDKLRKKIREFLQFNPEIESVSYEIVEENKEKEYTRKLIRYKGSENDFIKAYFLIPDGEGPFPAVMVHHQHNGERHLGKSEVCGLAGDKFQAFGPELARKGFVVLAPDSICFEDRRKNKSGIKPDDEYSDFIQHYNEMCYRILNGETLMKKVLEDASIGITLLENNDLVDRKKIGLLGHSYGGNTVLFQGAVDKRIKFSCSSGAVCSYKNKQENNTGIEMAEVIPGFTKEFTIQDLVKCFAPRKFLIVSATADKYSKDAGKVYKADLKTYKKFNAENSLLHKEYRGGHSLNAERFNFILNWFLKQG